MRMPDFRAYAEEPSPQASFGQHNIGCNKPGATSLKRTLELSSLLGKWGGNGTALKWESVLSPWNVHAVQLHNTADVTE